MADKRYTKPPYLTHDQLQAVWQALSDWFKVRRQYDKRFQALFPLTNPDPIAQLDADIWHSSLLLRMLVFGKEPLPEPPPTEHSYPVYNDLDPQYVSRRYKPPGVWEECTHTLGDGTLLKAHPMGHYRCACDGCWACHGKQLDCTCDIDWDRLYGHE